MKHTRTHASLIAILLMAALPGHGQQTPAPAPTSQPLKSFRVLVVFSDYDGDKKVSSLPYILHVVQAKSDRASLRIGLRVPVTNTSQDAHLTYLDTGTNIDCVVLEMDKDLYVLQINAERSWPIAPGSPGPMPTAVNSTAVNFGNQPFFQQFTSQTSVVLSDAQSLTTTVASDPSTGRVTKIEVTVNEEK